MGLRTVPLWDDVVHEHVRLLGDPDASGSASGCKGSCSGWVARTLLDFGMLTMPGDPVFYAAAAGSLNELWSPRVREVEAAFDEAMVSRLGYDAEQLLLYRCINSLVIGNAHDEEPYERDSGVLLVGQLFNSPAVAALLG